MSVFVLLALLSLLVNHSDLIGLSLLSIALFLLEKCSLHFTHCLIHEPLMFLGQTGDLSMLICAVELLMMFIDRLLLG